MKKNLTAVVALAGASALSSGALSAEILVASDISVSTTWTKSNTYNLQADVYINPGATLTIEPGTVIASSLGTNTRASLTVCKGARLIAIGTQAEPIIFTSKNDVATWTAGNPATGTWRPVCSEWGNLNILGAAYISEDAVAGNTASPSASNIAAMEGLVAAGPTDTRQTYGGGNDNDSSGTLSYCSFRYGGQVVGNNVELNGLSMGGVGRETVIDHIDIMNNLDDGIEVWGGTVNFNYVNIWNAGDDSLDIDQGWRGKLQYGLIVQGYAKTNGTQGSGIGDNGLEMDGAENSFYQPVTTGVMYNLTVIGNPGSGTGANGGDEATAWRDNCNMQIRQSVFMNFGQSLVRNENGADGAAGYGASGTLSFIQRWSTPYNFLLGADPANLNAPAAPLNFYKSQVDGNLCEIADTVAFGFPNAGTYTNYTGGQTYTYPYAEADAVGFSNPANANVKATALPVAGITRGANVTIGTSVVSPVISLDPRAANDAVTAALVRPAPNDGFFQPVDYRGAFSPTSVWVCDWTAADAFGFISTPTSACAVALPCPADLNGDGVVGPQDLASLLSSWGGSGFGDLNGDGTVGAQDLALVLSAWGNCP
jgi:hypothetical protein